MPVLSSVPVPIVKNIYHRIYGYISIVDSSLLLPIVPTFVQHTLDLSICRLLDFNRSVHVGRRILRHRVSRGGRALKAARWGRAGSEAVVLAVTIISTGEVGARTLPRNIIARRLPYPSAISYRHTYTNQNNTIQQNMMS